MRYKDIIFCDFDGTITTEDTLEGFMQQFISEDIRALGSRMAAEGYSIKRGVTELMSSIKSEDYRRKTDYFQRLPFREGFGDLLACARKRGIPVVVLSGGIREMTELALAPYREDILDLWAAQVDLSGEYVRFYSEYETETELVGKVGIMGRYAYDRAICIGDSYTDMEMASHAQIVFARDRLAKNMQALHKKFYPFETFYDIISALESLCGGIGDA